MSRKKEHRDEKTRSRRGEEVHQSWTTELCDVYGFSGESVREVIDELNKSGSDVTWLAVIRLLNQRSSGEAWAAGHEYLYLENRRLLRTKLCRICEVRDRNTVFLPCGHLIHCAECAAALHVCPMCNKAIKRTVTAYWVEIEFCNSSDLPDPVRFDSD